MKIAAIVLVVAAIAPSVALRPSPRVPPRAPNKLHLAQRVTPGPTMLGPIGTSAALIGAGNVLGYGLTVLTKSQYHVDLVGTG